MTKNIVLIGMPGSGKSTVGPVLAKVLGVGFIDTDVLVEQEERKSLQDIIDRDGLSAFLKIEERIISEMNIDGHVIATGGSVVYSLTAIEALKKNGIIVYLKLPYHQIRKRIKDTTGRGMVIKKGQGLLELYEERTPLYEKYADATVNCSGKNMETIIHTIIEVLQIKPPENHRSKW